MTLLILFAGAARTRFVASNFRNLLCLWFRGMLLRLLLKGDADNLVDVYINLLDVDALSGSLCLQHENYGKHNLYEPIEFRTRAWKQVC